MSPPDSPRPAGAPRDFSAIDTRDKAEALLRQGELEKLHMFPLQLGGQDVPANTCYVPLGIAAIKARLDATIHIMMESGQTSRYSAVPEYRGDSFVPSRVLLKAWRPGGETYAPVIEIW